MSILPGNFTSKSDEKRQFARYENLLDIEIENLKSAEKASRRFEDAMTGVKITPVIPVESASDILRRKNTQRQLAQKNLLTVMSGIDAVETLNNYFDDVDDLTAFNQFFTQFKNKKLEGLTMITPSLLNKLWDRFKIENKLVEEEGGEEEETKEERRTFRTPRASEEPYEYSDDELDIIRNIFIASKNLDQFVKDIPSGFKKALIALQQRDYPYVSISTKKPALEIFQKLKKPF
jgi:hypothetical protein